MRKITAPAVRKNTAGSRAEIERVVDYIRALPQDKLILSTIKYAD